MKKTAFATVVVMAVTLTACGGAGKTADSASGKTSSAKVTTSTSTPSTSSTTSGSTPSTAATSGGTGGGSNPGSAYCTELRGAKDKFTGLNFQGLSDKQFTQLTGEFDALAAAAPAAVKDDWSTLAAALKQVRQILSDAGLSFTDLKGLSSGQIPQGVTPQQLQRLGKKLQRFGADPSFQAAAGHISADAKAECGVTMGG